MLYCIIGALVFVLLPAASCAAPAHSRPIAPSAPTSPPITSACWLAIEEMPIESALIHFQDPISQQKFAGIDSRAGQGQSSIYTLSRFGPSDEKLTSGVTAILQPGEGLTVYLLLIYTLEAAHDLGFLATMDYAPLQVSFNGAQTVLPVVHFEPGSERAFRLSLPEVPVGLHTFVVSYLMDPDFYPDFTCSKPDARIGEFVGLRGRPFELGITLNVTPTAPVAISDWPAQARAFAPDETVNLHQAMLLKDCPSDGSGYVLTHDSAKAGRTQSYLVKFAGTVAGRLDMPVRLLVLWDDVLTQAWDMDVPVHACERGECLPLAIRVPSDLSPGTHSLTVMAYPYPHYLRFWQTADGSPPWVANAMYMGYLVGRVSVSVKR